MKTTRHRCRHVLPAFILGVAGCTGVGVDPLGYGSAIGKVRPLIEGMFHHAERESAEAE